MVKFKSKSLCPWLSNWLQTWGRGDNSCWLSPQSLCSPCCCDHKDLMWRTYILPSPHRGQSLCTQLNCSQFHICFAVWLCIHWPLDSEQLGKHKQWSVWSLFQPLCGFLGFMVFLFVWFSSIYFVFIFFISSSLGNVWLNPQLSPYLFVPWRF